MPTVRQLDDRISEWLEAEAPTQLPDRVLRATFERTRKTRQQGGWSALLSRMQVNRFVFALGGGAVVVLAVVLALGLYVNNQSGVGAPVPSPSPTSTLRSDPDGDVASGTITSPPPASETESTPSAAVSPRELPIAYGEDLTAGRYFLSEFPVGITFEIPPFEPPGEWFACSVSAVEQAVCHPSTADTPWAVTFQPLAVTFQIVDNVVVDPCSEQETAELRDPPVGPSVDDLVTAISNLAGYEAAAPVDITVSGFQGKRFTLTAPETGCGTTWATADRTTGMGPGERNLLQVLDVDGTRVLISGAFYQATPEADMAALEHVMDSVQIEN